jgi:hypothetical protein
VSSRLPRSLLVPVALGAVAALATACSGGGSDSSSKPTKKIAAVKASVTVTPGPVSTKRAGDTGDLSDADRDAILKSVTNYVEGATVAPLEGKKATQLDALFVPAAATRVDGEDHGLVTDDGVAKATGNIGVTVKPVALTALAGFDGSIQVVAASFDLKVSTKSAGGPVSIARVGELAFVQDAGQWKIESYKLLVTRDGAGLGGTTTTKAGSK